MQWLNLKPYLCTPPRMRQRVWTLRHALPTPCHPCKQPQAWGEVACGKACTGGGTLEEQNCRSRTVNKNDSYKLWSTFFKHFLSGPLLSLGRVSTQDNLREQGAVRIPLVRQHALLRLLKEGHWSWFVHHEICGTSPVAAGHAAGTGPAVAMHIRLSVHALCPAIGFACILGWQDPLPLGPLQGQHGFLWSRHTILHREPSLIHHSICKEDSRSAQL